MTERHYRSRTGIQETDSAYDRGHPGGGVSQGKTVAEGALAIGVAEGTYYRCRAEYGGLKLDRVKRLKQLEQEKTRLRRAVSNLTLGKLILREAASGTF